jgi:hypothetical protein
VITGSSRKKKDNIFRSDLLTILRLPPFYKVIASEEKFKEYIEEFQQNGYPNGPNLTRGDLVKLVSTISIDSLLSSTAIYALCMKVKPKGKVTISDHNSSSLDGLLNILLTYISQPI